MNPSIITTLWKLLLYRGNDRVPNKDCMHHGVGTDFLKSERRGYAKRSCVDLKRGLMGRGFWV
jgi:hypothetical protein